jgi:hypothetical protein
MSDYNVAMAMWQQAEPEIGHTTAWKVIRARLIEEMYATTALSRDAPPMIDPTRFCEEFRSKGHPRERSTLLPPAALLAPIHGPIASFETVIGN